MLNIMQSKIKTNTIFQRTPIWLFIGAFLILFPIFAYLTLENINRQENNSARILLEKGAALIRSFEAGTRLGMRGRFGSGFKLQKLLEETVQQPDIEYLLVADSKGRILAHGNPEFRGLYHGTDLDLSAISASDALNWRLVSIDNTKKIFEVYGKFSPAVSERPDHHDHIMPMHKMFTPSLVDPEKPRPELIIFVGLDMRSVYAAQTAATRQMVIMGIVLLLLAFSGITVLLLLVRYRFTKASLSRVQAFSDNLVENMPIGLITLDPEKQVTAMNHVACDLLSLSPIESLGKTATEIIPSTLLAPIDRIDPDKGIFEQEMECQIHSQTIPVEVVATLLKDPDEKIMGHLLLFKDQTEIHSLRKEIIRNQRLVTVGRLAAGIAHEIRNPLSSIKGFATYFKQQYQDNKQDLEISNIMIQEVERLNTVVSQLLEFAKPVTIQKKKTSVNALMADALKLVEHQAKENHIHLNTHFEKNDPIVSLDPNRMNQVLLNLFLNAIEAMKNGGNLSVTVAKSKENRGIDIRITDTGCGIPTENLSHLFDLYYTTKSTGTGLGLAIVHNILEAHNGKISVESIEGKGSTFTIYLPDEEH